MQQSLLRSALLGLTVFSALGCSDPVSPREEIADRFDGLAARLAPEEWYRRDALRIAAHTIRRGAPINPIDLTVGTATRRFDAVAVQTGFAHDLDFRGKTVIAWRGSNADELFHLEAYASELPVIDTVPPFEEDTGPLRYLSWSQFRFMKDTSEVWWRRSGGGRLEVISEGASCQSLSTNHTCRAIDIGVDFAVMTRLDVDDGSVSERSLVAPRTTLKGIRYIKTCAPPPVEGESWSCSVSLISEGTSGSS